MWVVIRGPMRWGRVEQVTMPMRWAGLGGVGMGEVGLGSDMVCCGLRGGVGRGAEGGLKNTALFRVG